MDVRMAVCELIVRDPVLRALLLNAPDRGGPGRCCDREGAAACCLVLGWTGEDPGHCPAAVQWLTARVELPRSPSRDRFYLDLVLQRLRTVVATPSAPFSTRCLGISPALLEGPEGTVAKVGTYEFTALPRRRDAGAELVAGGRGWSAPAVTFPAPGCASPSLN
ncbi:hypothetical protein ACI79C_18170 [Geodermatophilus sp. SYSU D00697]